MIARSGGIAEAVDVGRIMREQFGNLGGAGHYIGGKEKEAIQVVPSSKFETYVIAIT